MAVIPESHIVKSALKIVTGSILDPKKLQLCWTPQGGRRHFLRNYEGPWQHALSLLQAMQARRLQLGEINVGSAVQACLAVPWSHKVYPLIFDLCTKS